MSVYRIVIFAVLAISAVALPVPDRSHYTAIDGRTAGSNLLANSGFETVLDASPSHWRIHAGYGKHVSDGGFKGTAGVVIQKTDPNRKGRITQVLKNLKPNTRYIYGGKIRVQNSGGGNSAAFGVEGAS
ncbi:MAG TPA: fibronectin type III domain-containing protein, partial [Opitutales bacterium]|nr:fibronectin type III domain-containing protein [Opitutales bacterium]